MPNITFEFEPDRLNEIDAMVAEYGLADRNELLNNALTLMKWAANTTKAGGSVASVDEAAQQYRELDMPFLRGLRPAVS